MKKGFTLIELLAVIVILAIIALIAVPIVLNIIDNAKKEASIRSAENYLKAAEQGIANYQVKHPEQEINFEIYNINPDGDLSCDGLIGSIQVSVDGEKPIGGSLTILNGKITNAILNYSDKTTIVMGDDGKLSKKDSDEEEGPYPEFSMVNRLIMSGMEMLSYSTLNLAGQTFYIVQDSSSNDEYVTLASPSIMASFDENGGNEYETSTIKNVVEEYLSNLRIQLGITNESYLTGTLFTESELNEIVNKYVEKGISSYPIISTWTKTKNGSNVIYYSFDFINKIENKTPTNPRENIPTLIKIKVNKNVFYKITLQVENGTVSNKKYGTLSNTFSGVIETSPNPGYLYSDVTCTNGATGNYYEIMGNTLLLNNITSDTVCTIHYEKAHEITFIAENGTVDNNKKYYGLGSVSIDEIVATPNDGYAASSITCTNDVATMGVNGISGHYSTSLYNINSDTVCTIHFERGHEITFTAENGTVDSSKKYYAIGSISISEIAATPNDGYALNPDNTITCTNDVIIMGGVNVIGGKYSASLYNINSDTVCTIHFAKGYEITLQGINGTITPNKHYAINNANLNFESHANERYAIRNTSSVSCTDGVFLMSVSDISMGLSNVTSNTVCTVTFELAPKITLTSSKYTLEKTEFYGFNKSIALSELGISDSGLIPITCDNGAIGSYVSLLIAQMFGYSESILSISGLTQDTTCTIG